MMASNCSLAPLSVVSSMDTCSYTFVFVIWMDSCVRVCVRTTYSMEMIISPERRFHLQQTMEALDCRVHTKDLIRLKSNTNVNGQAAVSTGRWKKRSSLCSPATLCLLGHTALKPLINWTNIGRKCVQVWQSFYLTVVIQYSIVHICPQLHSCYTEATCTFSLSLWKLKTNIYLQLFQLQVFNFVGFFKNIFNGSGC